MDKYLKLFQQKINHGREAIPINEIDDNEIKIHDDRAITADSTNDKVYNHGQEAISVSENNNNNNNNNNINNDDDILQNYIYQIVKQELVKAMGNNNHISQ
jgi:hypothetical protein